MFKDSLTVNDTFWHLKVTQTILYNWANLVFLSSPRWIFISCLIGFLDASREVLHKKMQKVMLYVLWLYDTSMTNINSNMTLLRVRNHYTVIYNKKILLDMRYDEPLYPSIQRSLEWPFSWNYFTLMYHYGINTNILYLTFSRA